MPKATSEKLVRLEKKSKRDAAVKADAPAKVKTSKKVDELAAVPTDPSSSKPKKAKHALKPSENALSQDVSEADAGTKKGKKRGADVDDSMVEETGRKKRKQKGSDTAEKPKGKGEKVEAEVEEAQPSLEEVVSEKKKKRQAAAMEGKGESGEKANKKQKESAAEPKAAASTKAKSKNVTAAQVAASDKITKTSSVVEETPARPSPKESKKSKAKAVAQPVEPAPASDAEDDEVAEASGFEQEQEFYGFSSDDDDSSDEDEIVDDIPGIDIGKLPTVAKDDATVKRKLEKAKRKPTEDRGVIYLGRVPHGFYEDQMRAYFTQFGTVTRLRLSRNKKTGKSKHYGFVEFDSSSVAQIVAETMDNYLLMGCILTCKVIPKDQVHPQLWVGANRKWRVVPRDRVARVAHNKPRTAEELKKAESRLLRRQEQRKRKLEEAGIKYDFDAIAYKKKPKPTEA